MEQRWEEIFANSFLSAILIISSISQPFSHQNDSYAKTPEVWYTSKADAVYAIMLGWPENGIIELGDVKANAKSKITMIGFAESLNFAMESNRLKIDLPPFLKVFNACKASQWASVLKLTNVEPTEQLNAPEEGMLEDNTIKVEIS